LTNRFLFKPIAKVSLLGLLALIAAGVVLALSTNATWLSTEDVLVFLQSAAHWGPVILILIMAAAVVVSPIPSAPIAIAAGGVYGHYWGTVYALIGAELGALIAFEIARRLRRGRVSQWVGSHSLPSAVNSQLGLSAIVFAARLLPAISFDVISYAAGLTKLRRLWFAVSTAVGMVPATFLLSHAGAGLRGSEEGAMDVLVGLAGLGILAILGVIIGVYLQRKETSKWT
jgi:uncharacterized membrane protein YdjX (TVP38/TMEM64 family)